MAIYRHISTDLKHDGVFEPRIPSCRHQDQEDDKTLRISMTPTLEDCLTAIPNGGMNLEQLNMEQRGMYLLITIDTEKLGISEDDIITSVTLYEKDLVRDADITNEVWITKGFQVPKEDMQIIRVTDWQEVAHDIIPYSIIQIADEKYEDDYLTAYQDIYDDFVPCSIGIENVQYFSEHLEVGETVSFYVDDEMEYKAILAYINDMKGVEVIKKDMDEIVICSKENINLKKIFMFHADIVGLTI